MELTQFGAFLRQRRMELGLTQAELAQMLHVTDKAVSRWERGKGYPEVTLLEPLAGALELSLVELMQSRRIEGNLTKEEADAAAAGVLEISRQKKQRQRPRWFPAAAGFLVFVGIFILGFLFSGFFMEETYILTRLNPDFTLNEGFTGWDAILDQDWSSLDHTAYENGKTVGTTRFWNGLGGKHTVVHVDADGNELRLEGSGSSGTYENSHESVGSTYDPSSGRSKETILEGSHRILADRMVWYQVRLRKTLDAGWEFSKIVEIEYSTDNIGPDIIRETLLHHNGNTLGWRQYNYGFHGPTKAMDYDQDGNLLGYTVYTYEDSLRTTQRYDADDQLLESTRSWFTIQNQLKRRETYGADGSLTGVEEYHYRFWERFLSIEGLYFMIFLWGIGGFLGVDTYLQLKKNQEDQPSDDQTEKEDPMPKQENTSPTPVNTSEVDTWPYKVFCILFVIALLAIFAWGIFVEHPIVIPDHLTEHQQAEYLLEEESPGSELVRLLEYNTTTKTILLLAKSEGESRILYFCIHPVFTNRWGLVAQTAVPENATGTYTVGTLMDSWVVTLTDGTAGPLDIHQGIVNPTGRIGFWLDVFIAMVIALAGTVPAVFIRKKKRD